MSITIKLDAPALKALIANDADFELELQRSVTAEVMRNFLLRDASNILPIAQEILADVLMTKKEPSVYGSKLVLKANAVAEVKAVVDERSRELVHEAAAAAINELKEWLTTQLESRIRVAVQTKFDKQVNDAVEARLAEIRAAL